VKVWRLNFYDDATERVRVSWHSDERDAMRRLYQLWPELQSGQDGRLVGARHSIVPVTIPPNKHDMIAWLNEHLSQDNGNNSR
jgi:hypothetical protein